ncbi:MAG: PepSY domain-containing protein [Phycisphaerae bacterium]|nr:PepSY domain-containing protein [Phycisphaerae bacterium]
MSQPLRAVNFWSRRLHRWGAVFSAVPLLVVICTGLLLLLKKEFAWIQPREVRGSGGHPTVTFDQILAAASAADGPEITGWESIDRLEVRVGRGMTKVITKDRWEVQVDHATGGVLSAAIRRSDLIESLHDGTWFHSAAKLWVFLPSGLIALGLWITGVYLWGLPYIMRSRRKPTRGAGAASPGA